MQSGNWKTLSLLAQIHCWISWVIPGWSLTGEQQELALAFRFYCLFCFKLGISTPPVSFKSCVAFTFHIAHMLHVSDSCPTENSFQQAQQRLLFNTQYEWRSRYDHHRLHSQLLIHHTLWLSLHAISMWEHTPLYYESTDKVGSKVVPWFLVKKY